MISYELAKHLKDAGYPQTLGRGYKSHGKIPINSSPEEMERIECYFPTLSELIEACGPMFHSLNAEETRKPSVEVDYLLARVARLNTKTYLV
jgi:hypothetical protein